MPRVSIIIPHYGELSSLDKCLASLVITRKALPDVEIIVVDNGSPCGFEAVNELVGDRAQVFLEVTKGAGPARNAGVAASSGELIAFIDSDCVASNGWLRAGVEALAEFDIVGGAVAVFTQGPERSGAEIFELVFAFKNDLYIKKKGFTVTANLFCRREVFERTGGFSIGVSEDVDWCWRAAKIGFRLGYASDALVFHPARRSWNELISKWRRLSREMMHVRAQAGEPLFSCHLRAIAVALSAIPHSGRIMLFPGLSMRERLAGLLTLYRIRFWRAWHDLSSQYPPPM